MLQSFLGAVPLALFLSQYSTELLPVIYVWAGVFVFTTGLIILYSQKILTYFQFFTITSLSLSFSLLVLWFLFLFHDRPILSIFFIIWASVVAAFSSALIGIILNQLFTLQQAKRFFPFMQGGAASAGAMLVGFSLPFLASVIHLRNVPLIAAILMIASLFIVFLIKKYCAERFRSVSKPRQKKESFFQFHNKTYILFLFFFVFITNADEVTFSVLFSTEAKAELKNAASLAGFFGVLGAVCNILQSTIGLFSFKVILKKWGLFVALMLIPVTVSILLSFTFMAHFIERGFIFFAFLVVTRVVQTVLRNGILGSSFLLLFQPLKPDERLWATLQNRFTVSPISISLIGLILIGVRKFFGIDFVALSLCMFGIYFVTIVILTFVKKGYSSVLMNAITKHFFVNADFTDLDAESLLIVKNKLKSVLPEEATYALQTLENASREDFKVAIIEALDHPSDDVKVYALSKIRQYQLQSAESKIKEIIKKDPSKTVISHAILALASLQNANDLNLIKSHIYDSDQNIAASSLIALFKYGTPDDQKQALERLKISDDMLKAVVLKEINIDQKAQLLQQLLQSERRSVRNEAAKAAFDVHDKQIYRLLLENSVIPYVRSGSFASLVALKEPLFTEDFEKYRYEIQLERLKILGFVEDERTVPLLLQFLSHQDKRMSHEAIKSLNRLNFQVLSTEQKNKILAQISNEKRHILSLQNQIPNAPLLKDLVQREIELAQERIFLLLSLIYPKNLMMKALEGMRTKNPDMISYSIEILLQTLTPKETSDLLDILTFDPYAEVEKPFKEVDLQYVLNKHEDFMISSVQAACIFTIGLLQIRSFKDSVRAIQPSNALTEETKNWTLSQLL